MPRNPSRAAQGGDVEGETRIDVTMGEAIPVASASFDPGYSLESTLDSGTTKFRRADLVQGFCDYGHEIGEGS